MAYYRLYHIKGAHFAGFDEIEAADDVTAVREAERLKKTGHAELWCGGRKIKRLSPQQEATG